MSICPHDFFPNTKYDFKKCRRRHDDLFKNDFIKDESDDKVFHEKDFLEETLHIFEEHVHMVDSKVRKIKDRQDNQLYRGEISHEYQEKIDLIDLEVKRMLRECEHLGIQGDIREAEFKMDEVEKLRADKDAILSIAENPMLAQKQMKLCEVCGAMQSINDMETRNLSHLDGKLHLGFARLRKEIKDMKKRYESVLLEIEVVKERRRGKGRRGKSRYRSDYRRIKKKKRKSNRRRRDSRSRDRRGR